MKKVLLSSFFCIMLIFLFTGCISGYHVGGGFPRTLPGSVYANQKSTGYIAQKMPSMKDVEVLGKVYAEVEARQMIMWISLGDVSISTAKQEALRKYPEADDIVNIEIDMKHESILGLYNNVTMYLSGIAIKYKK